MPRANVIPNRSRQNERMMNNGWILGIMSAVAVLNDDEEFNLSNERLRQFIIDCDVLMYSMNKGMDDWKEILRKLEAMTGIRLNLRDGEKPLDGRFAIVEEGIPEDDAWDLQEGCDE